jgi:hypothetical protein
LNATLTVQILNLLMLLQKKNRSCKLSIEYTIVIYPEDVSSEENANRSKFKLLEKVERKSKVPPLVDGFQGSARVQFTVFPTSCPELS